MTDQTTNALASAQAEFLLHVPGMLTATDTKPELYRRAQELEIPGRSKMTKSELVHAIHLAELAGETGAAATG